MPDKPYEPARGGRYRRESPDGEPTLVERTEDHPQGNRRRDVKGRPLAPARAAAEAPAEKPATVKTAAKAQPKKEG